MLQNKSCQKKEVIVPVKCKTADCSKVRFFKHNIQLQLHDAYGVPVDGTQFWVTLLIRKEGPFVTIQLPAINFETGPYANLPQELPFIPALIAGGYIYTSDGFLPCDVRPNDIVNRSFFGPSNNGPNLAYSFLQDPATLPVPIAGYILQITNAGGLVIQGAGTVANIIPPGGQNVLPTTVSYIVEDQLKLRKNTIIQPGFINTTQFTNPHAANDGLRDSHVNDAFDNVLVWTWSDNSMIPDKTNGSMNAMVAIGSVVNGKLVVGNPIQLTDFGDTPNVTIFCTAGAINRTDPKNIVVSYGVNNLNTNLDSPHVAVTFDGGVTWAFNGPITPQPTGNPPSTGDNRGVASDKFGNIWYLMTNEFDPTGAFVNQPSFLYSIDGGITYKVAFQPPSHAGDAFPWDYPQFCFGNDNLGNYGLWFVASRFPGPLGLDGYPFIGFIQINGFNSIGPVKTADLTQFLNNQLNSSITAADDGRVWLFGFPEGLGPGSGPNLGSGITDMRNVFKSPGPITDNYAGPWDFAIKNMLQESLLLPEYDAQPVLGFFNSIQSNIYDNKRQALYTMTNALYPDNSQNTRIYFAISRDNGQTWSNPIDINNNDSGNRGFESMALDSVTGNLVFGFYDGRNDPTFQSVQYFGAFIDSKTLDKLVSEIPLSNPTYQISNGFSPQFVTKFKENLQKLKENPAFVELMKKRLTARKGRHSTKLTKNKK